MPHQEKNNVPPAHTTELLKDYDDSTGFESVLNLVNSSATIAPPPDFTPKVMRRLSELDIDPRRSSDRNSLNDRLQAAIGNLTSPATAMEMATCFFLSGFFYLVLGISLSYWAEITGRQSPSDGLDLLPTPPRRADRHGLLNRGVFIFEKQSPVIPNRQSDNHCLYSVFNFQQRASAVNFIESLQHQRCALFLSRNHYSWAFFWP